MHSEKCGNPHTAKNGDFLSLQHIVEVLSLLLTCHFREQVRVAIYGHHFCPRQVKLIALFYLFYFGIYLQRRTMAVKVVE